MEREISPLEARAALDTIDRGRRQVVDEIGLPPWYWWGLGPGWVGLGIISDLRHPWVTAAATLLFGAVHATVAPRVTNGRHRTTQLSVRAEVTGRYTAGLVIVGLIVWQG